MKLLSTLALLSLSVGDLKGSEAGTKYFRYAASNIPHREKLEKGGEDAYVATEHLLVVADGVGGWANRGIDSGLFSKQLVTDMKGLYEKKPTRHPADLMVDAC